MVDIAITGDRIVAVTPHRDGQRAAREQVDGRGAWVSPGLVDLHIHGAFGTSFATCDHDGFNELTGGLASRGITTVQASLVSLPPGHLVSLMHRLAPMLGPRPGRTTVHGLHLEGPYLSAAQAGAHDRSVLRAPDADEQELILDPGNGISMITIAPELPGAVGLIEGCARGDRIVVAVGHSDGGQDDFVAARRAGAKHITHLWSGQSLLTRRGPWRQPGMVEASLASDLSAEVIADGKHLPPTLLEIARRCIGDRLVVVSDATPGAGMPDGFRYRLGRVPCRVEAGVGVVEGQDAFGGSTTLIDDMLRYLVLELGWPLHQVLPMVTSAPASVLGLGEIGTIAVGNRADLVLWESNLAVRHVVVGGQPVDFASRR
ncbi:MAG TPA: amidohydrolase family protein [Microlunatus sp.]